MVLFKTKVAPINVSDMRKIPNIFVVYQRFYETIIFH